VSGLRVEAMPGVTYAVLYHRLCMPKPSSSTASRIELAGAAPPGLQGIFGHDTRAGIRVLDRRAVSTELRTARDQAPEHVIAAARGSGPEPTGLDGGRGAQPESGSVG